MIVKPTTWTSCAALHSTFASVVAVLFLAAGWECLLSLNGINVVSYTESLLRLFREGGGKGFDHYKAPPAVQKTALTRLIIESWLGSKYVVLQCFVSGHVF